MRRQKNTAPPAPAASVGPAIVPPPPIPPVPPAQLPNLNRTSPVKTVPSLPPLVQKEPQPSASKMEKEHREVASATMRRPATSSKDTQAFLRDFSTTISPGSQASGSSSAPKEDIERIIGRLSFSVPTEYQARLQNIIELRVKELRKDDQTRDLAQRPYEEGGLQLSTTQSEELLSLCAVREQLTVSPVQTMATTTPFNSFKHESTLPVSSVHQVLPPTLSASRTVPETPFGERSRNRPIVTDVTYKPLSIGPVEEIRAMTLTDFRRLSPVPRDAALRLEQKFTNLKGESVMLFIDSLEAWRQSSLYQEYTDRMLYAILHRSSLDSVLRKTKSITSEELAALIAMEKRLTF